MTAKNPADPPQFVPLVDSTHAGFPQQPGMAPVQHTTVTITQTPPKDYIVWSIFNLIHYNPCCLGLLALVFSVKARDRKLVGDMAGARSYGSTARGLNIAATVLLILLIFFIIIQIILIQSSIYEAFSRLTQKHK
ncbi:interferon-induced transmembrane protein 3-like [Pholidichthys leucotaenia]